MWNPSWLSFLTHCSSNEGDWDGAKTPLQFGDETGGIEKLILP